MARVAQNWITIYRCFVMHGSCMIMRSAKFQNWPQNILILSQLITNSKQKWCAIFLCGKCCSLWALLTVSWSVYHAIRFLYWSLHNWSTLLHARQKNFVAMHRVMLNSHQLIKRPSTYLMFVSYLLNPMISFSKNWYKYTEYPFPLKRVHRTAHELLYDTCVVDKIKYFQGWVEYDCPLGRLSERTRYSLEWERAQ